MGQKTLLFTLLLLHVAAEELTTGFEANDAEKAEMQSSPVPGDKKISISLNVAGNDGESEPYFATFDATNLAYQWKKLANSYDVKVEHKVKTGEVAEPVDEAKGEVRVGERNQQNEVPLEIANQVHEIAKQVKDGEHVISTLVIAETDPTEQKRRYEASKSLLSSSSVFKELTLYNVMYYIHLHQPFGLLILCDCWKDYAYAEALQSLDKQLQDSGLHARMALLYIYPEAWRRFQLDRAFQLSPDVFTLLGDSSVSEKKVLIPWGEEINPPPVSVQYEIFEECCGDKFELSHGTITSQGFELNIKRVDGDGKGWGQLLQLKWKIDPPLHDVPAFVIDNIPQGSNNEKSVFKKTTPDIATDLHNFIAKFFEQSLPLLVRSQPLPINPPLDRSPGHIIEVVGANFKDIVLDPTKDVFLLIYSPFCGASIAVQSLFEQTAVALKDDPNAVVARIDKTVNDIPVRGVVVQYFPTALLFPACEYGSANCPLLDFSDFNGSKTPHNKDVPHSHYTVEGMTAFVREHGFTYLGMVHKS